LQLFLYAQAHHFDVSDWQRVQRQLTALQHPVFRSSPLSPSDPEHLSLCVRVNQLVDSVPPRGAWG
jgi:hypothetical protein